MDERNSVGASVPDQALAVPVEPVSRLDPTGFDPSRDCIWFGPVMDGEESEGVEDLLAGNIICGQCEATLQTYATKCRVPAKAACAGFLCVEGARLHLRRRKAIAMEARRGETENTGSTAEGGDSAGRQASHKGTPHG